MLVCGIDEAGRGPVIGPMVMAGAMIEKEDEFKLRELGVKDSKLLAPKQRERLFPKIEKVVAKYKVVSLSPQEVDDALNSDDSNLNWLEAKVSAEIIKELRPEVCILDCPSPNIKEYTEHLKKLLHPLKTKLIVEHKADLHHISVAAASILAKVTRDREIEKIKQKIKIDFGSGYTSDPVTMDFLLKHHAEHQDIIRKTWSSYKSIKNMKHQKKLTDY
jgi:ribonuclease HII